MICFGEQNQLNLDKKRWITQKIQIEIIRHFGYSLKFNSLVIKTVFVFELKICYRFLSCFKFIDKYIVFKVKITKAFN